MKKTAGYFTCLLALSPLAAMADTPNLQQGTKSIAFAIFPGDRGAGLNGRYFINDNTALIGELNFNYIKTEENTTNEITQIKTRTVSIAGGVRNYFYSGDVTFFTDAVLFVGYGKSTRDSQFANASSSTNDTFKNAGLRLDFGAEYFFSPQVSISAKMGLAYTYSRTKSTIDYSNQPSISSNFKTWSFGTSQSAILLNYYW